MAEIIQEADILKLFFDSNPKLWIRDHQPALTRRAAYTYGASLKDQSGDTLISYSILVTHKNPFDPDENSVIRVDVDIATLGPSFPISKVERHVSISPYDSPIESCSWTGLDDSFVSKVKEISKHAGYAPVGRPTLS